MALSFMTLVASLAATIVSAGPTSLAASSTASAHTAAQYFITFGDSYSQTGFDITGTLANAANPLGNPAFPGFTTSGGVNWIGRLITEHNQSTLLSYDFASGGATTDANLVKPYATTVLSLVDQVSNFTNTIAAHPATTPWTANDTLFGVWIGVNDVGNTYYLSNVTDVITAIMSVYFAQLQILYDAGARNFVLLNCPPIQETPLMLSESSSDALAQEAAIIAKYNDAVAAHLANFTAANAGVTAKIVDTKVPFQTVIDDPTAYGAPNATCFNSDGKSCIWFNNYHPGLAIHKLVAEAVAQAWKGRFFK